MRGGSIAKTGSTSWLFCARLKSELRKDPAAFAARRRAYSKLYTERHPGMRRESVAKYNRSRYEQHPEISRAATRKWRKANLDKARIACEKWQSKHPTYHRDRMRHKRATDPLFVLTAALRDRIYRALKRAKKERSSTRFHRDAAAVLEWFEWLRAKGVADWTADGVEIDHVLPVLSFDVSCPMQAYAANHWTNLFPLHWRENLTKHARIDAAHINRQRALVADFIRDRFPLQRAA